MTEEHVPVRLSHLLRDCSVGAIVRGSDSLMTVQDIRTWDRPGGDPRDREICYVDRVRSALGIDRVLCAPPRMTKRDGTVIGWIPALRFPTWMRCLRCGLMYHAPWRRRRATGDDGEDTESRGEANTRECSECGGRLEQTPWVLVHEDGYLADVPWHGLAHEGTRSPGQRQCRPDWSKPYLKLDESGTDRRILCTRDGCGANTTFPSGALPRYSIPGSHLATALDARASGSIPRSPGLVDGDQRRAGALAHDSHCARDSAGVANLPRYRHRPSIW